MSLHDRLRERLLQSKGIPTKETLPSNLADTEWSSYFEALMRNRLILGAMRYGPLNGGPKHRNVESAIKRLKIYLKTGNQEHLVDAANLCLVEFCKPGSHASPHFCAQDEHTFHTRTR